MKQGSEYAKRVKRLLGQLLKKYGKPEAVEPVDPIEQLIVGILAGCTTHTKALAVYRKLRQHVVDLNELRVTPAMELAEQIGDAVPLGKRKAQNIVDALNAIRKRQDSLDLSFLKQRGRREAREYLEALEGVDHAAAASVVLFSLGGHALPLDDLILYVLQKEEMVDPTAPPAEVQGFLERCISSSQAQVSYELLSRYAASKTLRVPYDRLRELVRPPSPDGGAKKAPVAAVITAPVPAAVPPKPGASAKPGALPKPAAAKAAPAHPVKAVTVPAAKSPAAPAKAHVQSKPATPVKAPAAKPNTKKPSPETRVAEPAAKTGGNHDHAAAKAAAVRKKK